MSSTPRAYFTSIKLLCLDDLPVDYDLLETQEVFIVDLKAYTKS